MRLPQRRHAAMAASWVAFTAVAAVVGVSAVQLAGDSSVESAADLVPETGIPAGPPAEGPRQGRTPADGGSAAPRSPAGTDPTPSAEPSPSVSPSPGPDEDPTVADDPADEPGASTDPTPGAEPTSGASRAPEQEPSTRAPEPSTSSAPRADPTRSDPAPAGRTFRSAGGSVTVTCFGSRPDLRSYAPAGGYRVVETSRDDDEVTVEFARAARTVTIEVACSSAGDPVAEVDVDDDSDDADDDADDGDDG